MARTAFLTRSHKQSHKAAVGDPESGGNPWVLGLLGQFPPLGTIGASVTALHHVAALRRVEARDGFDEDISLYKHLAAIAEFGAEFDRYYGKSRHRGCSRSWASRRRLICRLQGRSQIPRDDEFEDHNVLRTCPYIGRVAAASAGSPLKRFTDRDGEQASLSGRSKSAHNARDHNL